MTLLQSAIHLNSTCWSDVDDVISHECNRMGHSSEDRRLAVGYVRRPSRPSRCDSQTLTLWRNNQSPVAVGSPHTVLLYSKIAPDRDALLCFLVFSKLQGCRGNSSEGSQIFVVCIHRHLSTDTLPPSAISHSISACSRFPPRKTFQYTSRWDHGWTKFGMMRLG